MRDRKPSREKQTGWGIKMADRTGLEPATSAVTGRHSNQLNYRSATYLDLYDG